MGNQRLVGYGEHRERGQLHRVLESKQREEASPCGERLDVGCRRLSKVRRASMQAGSCLGRGGCQRARGVQGQQQRCETGYKVGVKYIIKYLKTMATRFLHSKKVQLWESGKPEWTPWYWKTGMNSSSSINEKRELSVYVTMSSMYASTYLPARVLPYIYPLTLPGRGLGAAMPQW